MSGGTLPSGIKTAGTNSTPSSSNNHQRSHSCRCPGGLIRKRLEEGRPVANTLGMPLLPLTL